MAPGPALIPVVVQGRRIFQLTGEVKAALQTISTAVGKEREGVFHRPGQIPHEGTRRRRRF